MNYADIVSWQGIKQGHGELLMTFMMLKNLACCVAGGGDWTETPSSMNGSPTPMSPYTDGSHCSPMAVSSPASAALLPQQQHQQAVQQSLLRNLRISASGELTTSGGCGVAGSWQPINSSPPGSTSASCDTLSLSLTSLDPGALSTAHSQLLSQQQAAQANMEQMVTGLRAGGSELSFSSSFDGKGGVKGLLSAGVSFLAGGCWKLQRLHARYSWCGYDRLCMFLSSAHGRLANISSPRLAVLLVPLT